MALRTASLAWRTTPPPQVGAQLNPAHPMVRWSPSCIWTGARIARESARNRSDAINGGANISRRTIGAARSGINGLTFTNAASTSIGFAGAPVNLFAAGYTIVALLMSAAGSTNQFLFCDSAQPQGTCFLFADAAGTAISHTKPGAATFGGLAISVGIPYLTVFSHDIVGTQFYTLARALNGNGGSPLLVTSGTNANGAFDSFDGILQVGGFNDGGQRSWAGVLGYVVAFPRFIPQRIAEGFLMDGNPFAIFARDVPPQFTIAAAGVISASNWYYQMIGAHHRA